jgi:cell division protein FtsB
MRRSRFLPYGIAILVIVGLVSGCSRGPSEEELARTAFEESLATLQEQYDALQQARADLAASNQKLAELEAVRERDRSDEQKAEIEALPATIEEQTAARDAAYETVQATLADFLNIALNDFPEHPATVQGLNMYSDEAILVADDTVAKAGDYKKAIGNLEAASSYYDSIGLPPYQPLVDKIAELDDMRFITQERFDEVKKNMTMDEVKAVAGVPYYQNIQVDEKRKVETWLYRKREGGAAAIYFKTTNNKVYNKNFDAIKVKVVEDE